MKSLPVTLCFCAAALQAQRIPGSISAYFGVDIGGNGQDYAGAVTSDPQGNTYVAGRTYSNNFPVTAGAYQTTFGGTSDAWVAKLGANGLTLWATYLGGELDEVINGIALDSSGNVWVAGWTGSPNFPIVNQLPGIASGANAFVAEFDPTGAKLLFSSLLSGVDSAGIAIDSGGNAYVAVNAGQYSPGITVVKISPQGTLAYSYTQTDGVASGIAVDSTGAAYVAGSNTNYPPTGFTLSTFYTPGNQFAIAFKISADGKTRLYEKTFGGSTYAAANAIAVDSAGEAWIGGSTDSADFPLVNPLPTQNTLGARPIYQTTDGGVTWKPIDGLPFALPQMTAVDPSNPSTLYEATADLGVFKSTNGGATWTQANTGIASTYVLAIAVDPANTQTLYASSTTAIYKSTDGAATWTQVDKTGYAATQIVIDAQNDSNVYTVCTNVYYGYQVDLRKSTDGGATWNNVSFPQSSGVAALAADPRVSGHLVAISNQLITFSGLSGNTVEPYFYRSTDGGNTWTQVAPAGQPTIPGQVLVADPSTNPTTFYAGLLGRSQDGGATWSAFPSLPATPGATGIVAGGAASVWNPIAVDPGGVLYAAVTSGASQGFYVSHDHGTTWTQVAAADPVSFWLYAAGSSGTLYGVTNEIASSGFVSKLSADGSTLAYSTYLRGHATGNFGPFYASEPNYFQTENWVAGIALDPSGNVAITGGTHATDFPVVNAVQSANEGMADAFASTIAADGSALTFSTYLGGSADDGALAASFDPTGNVLVVGQTFSPNMFGFTGQFPFTYGDGFVEKLATGPPVISAVLNGASYQPGIESGSWAMITGFNLSGFQRTWSGSDFTLGDAGPYGYTYLPTQLSDTTVTIDGKPAFPYYISPTQINVQVPTDTATGPVNVVVTYNGVSSKPVSVTLQNYAPAFFLNLGTSYPVATSLPDYSLVGLPHAPAEPGDTVVLWGTGFGPTNPPTAAGEIVSGAPATDTLPTVTIGGTSATVISSVMTNGSAGLYQITVQIPASALSGAVPIQASIGGAKTPAGTTLFIGQPAPQQ